MSENEKLCFVISPIGEAESDIRKRSDQVLRHIIRPAADACGYTAMRADEIDKPGIITSQVIQHVVADPLVIADLTDTNPNVFYELAIRHAIRKPLVQIIRKGERIPFDVAGTRTIYFDHKDLDSVDLAKDGIIEQIKASEANPNDIETPISVSLDLQILRQSENPEERSLADLVSAVTDVRNDLSKLNEKISLSPGPSDATINELVETMPRRIAKEITRSPRPMRYKKTVDPYLIKKLTRGLPSKTGNSLGILIATSFYRDHFPWLYEIGMEAYRRAIAGDWKGAKESIHEMRIIAEMSIRSGPWLEDWIGNEKEAYILMEELPMLLERLVEEGSDR